MISEFRLSTTVGYPTWYSIFKLQRRKSQTKMARVLRRFLVDMYLLDRYNPRDAIFHGGLVVSGKLIKRVSLRVSFRERYGCGGIRPKDTGVVNGFPFCDMFAKWSPNQLLMLERFSASPVRDALRRSPEDYALSVKKS